MNCEFPCPYDRAGTPCQKPIFHLGNHSWPTEIPMEDVLPTCRVCGKKAARCPCPAMGADGRANAVMPPEPEPTPAQRRILELNARMHAPVPGTARPVALPTDVRPWCRRHGWTTECGCEDKPRMER